MQNLKFCQLWIKSTAPIFIIESAPAYSCSGKYLLNADFDHICNAGQRSKWIWVRNK